MGFRVIRMGNHMEKKVNMDNEMETGIIGCS